MSHGIAENIAEMQEVSAPDASPPHLATTRLLRVTECVPNDYHVDLRVGLRVNHVGTEAEALGLPWIRRLPGEKRVKVLHGQVFVVQEYLGWKLIRAHISHAENCGETTLQRCTTLEALPIRLAR
jgi:hypothetical protein